MENIQAYTQRIMQEYDTNQNGLIELQPTVLSNHQEVGPGYSPDRTRTFFEMARNRFFPAVADQWNVQQVVAHTIDTNHDQQIGFMEKVKAWFKFGLW